MLDCPQCGSELVYEDATFCPKCGESLTIDEDEKQEEVIKTQQQTDLMLVATLLTMISGTFVASLGYLCVYQYFALIDYYGSSIASEVFGFLVFGAVGLIAGTFALAGAFFMLKRKLFIFSLVGTFFPLVSLILAPVPLAKKVFLELRKNCQNYAFQRPHRRFPSLLVLNTSRNPL